MNTVIDDDYRRPNPFDVSLFEDDASEFINDGVARIEALKLRIIGHPRLTEMERDQMTGELNHLRAAHLFLASRVQMAGSRALGSVTAPHPRKALELEGVLGQNEEILANLERISRLARSRLTILLEGETGAGKELFARLIHHNSERSKLISVNCGAIPAGLVESELFGHVKGAFTGAVSDRRGRFEEASGGTLFLDEIGELDLNAQVKLLRVLDVGEIQRVGSDKVQHVDVRVIAATNRDLSRMVEAEKFREDLLFRLNICQMRIPPLRERRDEIPLLLEYFIGTTCSRESLPMPRLDRSLRYFLTDLYSYPGNIRELKNLSLYITHIYNGTPVGFDDLPIRYARLAREMAGAASPEDGWKAQQRATQAGEERQRLVQFLASHQGNVPAVSDAMGLSRARIYQLCQKHGLKPGDYRGA